MKKRLLVIDGMFFANRTLFGAQAANETLTLNSEQEQHNLLSMMHNSIMNILQSFNNDQHTLIHNVIIVEDYDSWRKHYPVYKPLYFERIGQEHVPVLGYKENRKEKKEKSEINYDNFYGVSHQFFKEINSKYPVLKVAGCEGDDLIMLLSKTFAKSDDYELLVFCTDGDLVQTVNDNCMLFRDIRSKDCPCGEFVISPNKMHEYMSGKNVSAEARLLSGLVNMQTDMDILFSMCFNSTQTIKREPGKGIRYATPIQIALTKCVCGDAKDNIFPILRKPKSETAKKNLSVSEKQLVKTVEMILGKFNEKNCYQVMNDKETRDDVFTTLRSVFKDDNYPLDKIEEHFQHNYKINVLTMKNLSEQLVDEYKRTFTTDILPRIKEPLDSSLFEKDIRTTRDNATDLLASSAPKDLLY